MPLLKLPNLGTRGINTDVAPWDLPQEFISDGVNFRVESNSLSAYGGYEVRAQAPLYYYPTYGVIARPKSGVMVVTAGLDKIFALQGATYTDISNNSSVQLGDEWAWSGCLNGSITVLNNQFLYPVYWDGSGTVEPLPWNIVSSTEQTTWSEEGKSADVVRSHKNFLIALNLHEETDKPDSYRWSHPASENGIPFTWDENRSDGIAGISSLGGDGGPIIDGLSLRDSFVIYSANAIDILDLTGDEFVWRRRELSSNIGLLAKDCVVEVKGAHYFMSTEDIYVTDGNSIQSIAQDTIRERLGTVINTDYLERCFAFNLEAHNEIWFCIPSSGSEYCNLAFVYHWLDKSWSIRELPDGTSHVVMAPETIDAEDWKDANQTWENRVDRWSDGIAPRSYENLPYALNYINSDFQLLQPEFPSEDLNCLMERTDLAIVDQVTVTTITKIYPHIQGSKPVRIQIGSQDFPGSAVRWKPYNLFDPTQQRKIDVRTTGALHTYRILSDGTGFFRFSGMDLEYVADGVR